MLDDITQAELAREDVARYLRGGHGQTELEARERIHAYLDELRPPIIAAGINLFGGPLRLLHRHVTGAIPIRRNTKDPAYLVTLKAYLSELLQRSDLLFYIEGGRSYSGEMKAPKTGLLHAALQA